MAAEEGQMIPNVLPSAEEELQILTPRSLDTQMDRNAGIDEDAGGSRKRKTMQIATETPEPVPVPPVAARPLLPSSVHYYPVHQQPPSRLPSLLRSNTYEEPDASASNPTVDLLSLVGRTSYTRMLTRGEEQEYFPPQVRQQTAHIDQLISTQATQLRQTVSEVQRRQYFLLANEAEEKAAKKVRAKDFELNQLKFKNSELERKEFLSRRENQTLHEKVQELEIQAEALRFQLRDAIFRHRKIEVVAPKESKEDNEVVAAKERKEETEVVVATKERKEENEVDVVAAKEGEEENEVEVVAAKEREDENEVEVVAAEESKEETEEGAITCKVCSEKRADTVLSPCGHLCACRACDESLTACPVCNAAKTSSVQVSNP